MMAFHRASASVGKTALVGSLYALGFVGLASASMVVALMYLPWSLAMNVLGQMTPATLDAIRGIGISSFFGWFALFAFGMGISLVFSAFLTQRKFKIPRSRVINIFVLAAILALWVSSAFIIPQVTAISSTQTAEYSQFNTKPCSFYIFTDSTNYYAQNCDTGVITYGGPGNAGGATGTSFASVMTNALNIAAPGGSVVLASGSYTVASNIKIPTADSQSYNTANEHWLTVVGQGPNTVLVAGYNGPIFNNSAASQNMVVNFENFRATGQNGTFTATFLTGKVFISQFNHLWIENFRNWGFDLKANGQGADCDSWIINSFFQSNGIIGASSSGAINIQNSGCNDLHIRGNWFSLNFDDIVANTFANLDIQGNTMTDIVGNTSHNSNLIYLTGAFNHATIQENKFDTADAKTNPAYVFVNLSPSSGTHDILIQGNTFYPETSQNFNFGLILLVAASQTVSNLQIQNNQIAIPSGITAYAWFSIQSSSTGTVTGELSGNVLSISGTLTNGFYYNPTSGATVTKFHVLSNQGYNPKGIISSPFDTGSRLNINDTGGGSATPTNSTTFTVVESPKLIIFSQTATDTAGELTTIKIDGTAVPSINGVALSSGFTFAVVLQPGETYYATWHTGDASWLVSGE